MYNLKELIDCICNVTNLVYFEILNKMIDDIVKGNGGMDELLNILPSYENENLLYSEENKTTFRKIYQDVHYAITLNFKDEKEKFIKKTAKDFQDNVINKVTKDDPYFIELIKKSKANSTNYYNELNFNTYTQDELIKTIHLLYLYFILKTLICVAEDHEHYQSKIENFVKILPKHNYNTDSIIMSEDMTNLLAESNLIMWKRFNSMSKNEFTKLVKAISMSFDMTMEYQTNILNNKNVKYYN